MAALKTTCLAEIEKEYGAKTSPVSGWSLAKNFPGGASAEERHTIENCSVFDLCHNAIFRISGAGAFEEMRLLLSVSDVTITPDKVFRGAGFTFIAMAENDGLLLAADRAVLKQLKEQLTGVDITDLSDALARLDIAGAKLAAVLEDFDIQQEDIPTGDRVLKKCVAEVNAIIIEASQFKIPAITLLFNAEYAEGMWEEFIETYPVKPAGFSAYDVLTEQ